MEVLNRFPLLGLGTEKLVIFYLDYFPARVSAVVSLPAISTYSLHSNLLAFQRYFQDTNLKDSVRPYRASRIKIKILYMTYEAIHHLIYIFLYKLLSYYSLLRFSYYCSH